MNVQESREPFPHWIVTGFWNEHLLAEVVQEVPPLSDPRWQQFNNRNERKFAMTTREGWGPSTRTVMDYMLSDDFIEWLFFVTGIPALSGRIEGGGIHNIQPGGVLGTHVDFNRASDSGMYRRLNCLLYLNDAWTDDDGGHLELRKNADDLEPAVSILPTRNTMVVFETSDSSWHGHPAPLPGPRSRLSLACYFYTHEPPPNVSEPHSTIFSEGGV